MTTRLALTLGVGFLSIVAAGCARPISVAAVGGPVLARPSIEDLHGSLPVDEGWGGLAGARGTVEIAPRWTLQAEVLVAHERFASFELPTDTPVRVTSLALPVMAGFSLGVSGRVEVAAGLRPSFQIRARRALRGEDQDILEDLRPADLAGVLSAAVRLSANGRLQVGLRYVAGFTNLDATNWFDHRRRLLEIAAGYRWWRRKGCQ